MNNKNKPFQATVFSKSIGVTSEVLPFGGDMAICLDQGIVIITKQQAMDFWGLVEDNDNIDQEKCPAIDGYCKYYSSKNTSIHGNIAYCSHVDNKFKMAVDNCNSDLCPILVKNN